MKYVEKGIIVKDVYECATRIGSVELPRGRAYSRGKQRIEKSVSRTWMMGLVNGYSSVARLGGWKTIGCRREMSVRFGHARGVSTVGRQQTLSLSVVAGCRTSAT